MMNKRGSFIYRRDIVIAYNLIPGFHGAEQSTTPADIVCPEGTYAYDLTIFYDNQQRQSDILTLYVTCSDTTYLNKLFPSFVAQTLFAMIDVLNTDQSPFSSITLANNGVVLTGIGISLNGNPAFVGSSGTSLAFISCTGTDVLMGFAGVYFDNITQALSGLDLACGTPCAAGHAGVGCPQCSIGNYQAAVGQSTCNNCSAGTFASLPGSVVCESCPPGSYQNRTAQGGCELCPAGTYAPSNGSVSCTMCPLGWSSPANSTACSSCAAGSYAVESCYAAQSFVWLSTAPDGSLVGVGADNAVYTRPDLSVPWELGGYSNVPVTSALLSYTDGYVGAANNRVYRRQSLSAPWQETPTSCCSRFITQTPSGGYIGYYDQDGSYLQTEASIDIYFTHIYSGSFHDAIQLRDGTTLVVTANYDLAVIPLLELGAPLSPINDTSLKVKSITQLKDGSFVALASQANTCPNNGALISDACYKPCPAGSTDIFSSGTCYLDCPSGHGTFNGETTDLGGGLCQNPSYSVISMNSCPVCVNEGVSDGGVPIAINRVTGETTFSCTCGPSPQYFKTFSSRNVSCFAGTAGCIMDPATVRIFTKATLEASWARTADDGTVCTAGPGSCSLCPAGTYTAAASTHYIATSSASYASPENSVCTPCPHGTYSHAGGTSCSACAAGFYQDETGQTSCKPCPAGSFSTFSGSGTCSVCPLGSFASVAGSSVCTSCDSGTYAVETCNTTRNFTFITTRADNSILGLASDSTVYSRPNLQTPWLFQGVSDLTITSITYSLSNGYVGTGSDGYVHTKADLSSPWGAAISYVPAIYISQALSIDGVAFYVGVISSGFTVVHSKGSALPSPTSAVRLDVSYWTSVPCLTGYIAVQQLPDTSYLLIGADYNLYTAGSSLVCPTNSEASLDQVYWDQSLAVKSVTVRADGSLLALATAERSCPSGSTLSFGTCYLACPPGATDYRGTGTCYASACLSLPNLTMIDQGTTCFSPGYSYQQQAECSGCDNLGVLNQSCLTDVITGVTTCQCNCADFVYTKQSTPRDTPCATGTAGCFMDPARLRLYTKPSLAAAWQTTADDGTVCTVGATTCSPCPGGSYTPSASTYYLATSPASPYMRAENATCSFCGVGTYSHAGDTSCSACAAGFYQDETGQTSCKPCPAGSFSMFSGSGTCSVCPLGSFASVSGNTICASCDSGTYAVETCNTSRILTAIALFRGIAILGIDINSAAYIRPDLSAPWLGQGSGEIAITSIVWSGADRYVAAGADGFLHSKYVLSDVWSPPYLGAPAKFIGLATIDGVPSYVGIVGSSNTVVISTLSLAQPVLTQLGFWTDTCLVQYQAIIQLLDGSFVLIQADYNLYTVPSLTCATDPLIIADTSLAVKSIVQLSDGSFLALATAARCPGGGVLIADTCYSPCPAGTVDYFGDAVCWLAACPALPTVPGQLVIDQGSVCLSPGYDYTDPKRCSSCDNGGVLRSICDTGCTCSCADFVYTKPSSPSPAFCKVGAAGCFMDPASLSLYTKATLDTSWVRTADDGTVCSAGPGSCSLCPAGTYLYGSDAYYLQTGDKGPYASLESSVCTPCPTGQTSDPGSAACVGLPTVHPSSAPSKPTGQPTSMPTLRRYCVVYGMSFNASVVDGVFFDALNAVFLPALTQTITDIGFLSANIRFPNFPVDGACASAHQLPQPLSRNSSAAFTHAPSRSHRPSARPSLGVAVRPPSGRPPQAVLRAMKLQRTLGAQVLVSDIVVGGQTSGQYSYVVGSLDSSLQSQQLQTSLTTLLVNGGYGLSTDALSSLSGVQPFYTQYPTGTPTGQPSGQPTSQPTLEAPPQLVGAIFDNNGAGLTVSFDQSTDQGGHTNGTWVCSALLVFPGAASALCSWPSPSVIAASLPYNAAAIAPNDSIVLLDGKVRRLCASSSASSCAQHLTSTAQQARLQGPLVPVSPAVSLVASALVGRCDDVVLDASATSGGANRQWTSLAWLISGTGGSDVAALQTRLNTYTDLSSPVVLPNALLSQGELRITLSLTNFFAQSSSATKTVVISTDRNVPAVFILGSPLLSIFSSDVLALQSVAAVAACADSYVLTYSWAVRDSAGAALSSIVSQSADVHTFLSKAYDFAAGANYTVTLHVSSIGLNRAPSAASASVQVSVNAGAVIASIAGSPLVTASSSAPLQLDASASFDQTYSAQAAPLSYNWSCLTGANANCDAALTFAAGGQFVAVNTGLLTVGVSYSVSVLVVQPLDGRNASASVTVQAVSPSSPVVQLAASALRVSPGSVLEVRASVSAQTAVLASWSSADAPPLDLASVATTAPQRLLSAAQCQAGIAYNLALDTTLLTPGRKYTFRLSAVSAGNSALSGSGDVAVTVRAPPSSGRLSASPASGTALSTEFLLRAVGWATDSDAYPLSFDYRSQAVGATTSLLLQLRIARAYVTATLAAGAAPSNYAVSLLVRAYDAFNATASAATTVQVLPAPTSSVLAYLAAGLNKSTLAQDYTSALLTVNNVAQSFSLQDCAHAPDCASLLRSSCLTSSVPNVCGACLPGSYGLPFDSNFACAASAGTAPRSPGALCSQGSQCLGGQCLGGLCGNASAPCPVDAAQAVCGGHGSCLFVDSSFHNVSYCSAADPACQSVCVCDAGFFGHSCDVSEADYTARQLSVALNCDTAAYLQTNSDASFHVLEALVGTLDQSFSGHQQQSAASLTSCLSAFEGVSALALSELALDAAGLAALGRVFALVSKFAQTLAVKDGYGSGSAQGDNSSSIFISFGRRLEQLPSHSSARLLASFSQVGAGSQLDNSLTNFTKGILASMTPGQSSLQFQAQSFSTRLYNNFADSFGGAVVEPPVLSQLASLLHLDASGLQACAGFSSFASFSVASFLAAPFNGSQVVQTPLLRWYSSASAQSAALPSGSYSSGGGFFLVLPFSQKQQTLTPFVTLSSFSNRTIPVCQEHGPNGYQACNGCFLSSYDESSATFRCPDITSLCPQQQATNALANWDSLKEYSAFVESIEAEILGVFSAHPIDWATAGYVVAIVAFLLLVLFVGLYVFYMWDMRDRNMLTYAYKLPNSKKLRDETDAGVQALRERVNDMFLVGIFSEEDFQQAEWDVELDRRTCSWTNMWYPVYSRVRRLVGVPSFLKSQSSILVAGELTLRFMQDVLRFHPFLSHWVGASMVKTRSIRFLAFYKSFIISLFTSTLIFGVYYPFDDTCPLNTTEAGCLAQPSKLVSGLSECQWDVNLTDGYTRCSLRPPPTDFVFTIVVAIVTSLISLPFDLSISWVLINLCTCDPDCSTTKPLLADDESAKKMVNRRASLGFLEDDASISYILRSLHNFTLRVEEKKTTPYEEHVMDTFAREMGLRIHKGELRPSLWHRLCGRSVTDTIGDCVKQAKAKGDVILRDVIGVSGSVKDSSGEAKETLLMQELVNELLSFLGRKLLTPHLDQYRRTFPPRIHPLKVFLGWAYVVTVIVFFIIWVLLWGFRNSGVTLRAWVVNFVLETLWGCFVSSTLRVFLVHVILLAWIRPQIAHACTGVVAFAENYDHDEVQEGASYLYQAISPVCYASRLVRRQFPDLPLALIINRLTDADIIYLRNAVITEKKEGFYRHSSILSPIGLTSDEMSEHPVNANKKMIKSFRSLSSKPMEL